MEKNRFWSKVDKRLGCWEWTGALNRGGYGVFWVEGKAVLAHRYSYKISNSNFSEEMVVRHKCDNRVCVNPNHLEMGTIQDNLKDRNRRNRVASGVQNGRAKLTPQKVEEIRRSLDTTTQTALAKKFRVSRKTIYLIKNNAIW